MHIIKSCFINLFRKEGVRGKKKKEVWEEGYVNGPMSQH